MSGRRMTPRGQMTKGTNSGPAIMMMPPHIRATFMPNPPLKHIPPLVSRRKQKWTGVFQYLEHFEKTPAPERVVNPTPKALKQERGKRAKEQHDAKIKPLVDKYRKHQRDCGGEFQGMNCYNTLFVGRLAYEVTERKLLREMEAFGPVKDIKLIKNKDARSRGYAFIEYEHEEDMKRAYRAADGIRIEGREIVADVERGHTVPTWLPRRLGGGLGGTRLGGKDKNVTAPGRYDPSKPNAPRTTGNAGAPPSMGRGGGSSGGAPFGYGYGGSGRGRGMGGGSYFDSYRDGPPPMDGPPPYGRGRGGGSDRHQPAGGGRDWDRGSGGRYGGGSRGSRKRHRSRSRSPDRHHSRRRY